MTTYTTVFGNDAIPPSTSGYSALALTTDVILFWPELAQGNYLATDIIDITSDAVHAVTLPSASEVSIGRSLLINNLSVFTVTIKDSSGATIATMLPGNIKNIYLIDNSTVSGLWRVYTFGTGTSAADAASLAGYGLSVIAGDLAQTSPAKITASGATVLVSDRAGTYIFKASGMVTCSLPSAFAAGDGFFLNVVNQGTGAVTLDPNSSETIDGLFTRDLAPGESATVICDGTNWVTVGYGRSTQFQFTKLVLDITTGSPFTLTSTQAENKLLQFIGTPTAPVTIILPAVVAVYYIQCSYAGAFATTIGAGGSTINVLGTDRVIAYCDGIDVVFAQTSAVPASNIAGGVAGAVLVQTGIGATGFTAVGASGQTLRSAGTGIATWVDSTAANTSNTPAGGISATNVQTAINELDTEKAPKNSPTFTGLVTIPQYLNFTSAYGAIELSGVDVIRFGGRDGDNSGQLAGFRNILINPRISAGINQRGVANWAAVAIGAYGYDRWKKVDANTITQVVEDGNYTPSAVYTLSGNVTATQQVTSPASGHWTIPAISNLETDVQLEEGYIASKRERRPKGLEEFLCQRYYLLMTGIGIGGYNLAVNTVMGTYVFPVTMRVTPTLAWRSFGTQLNATSPAFLGTSAVATGIAVNAISTGAVYIYGASATASAELS